MRTPQVLIGLSSTGTPYRSVESEHGSSTWKFLGKSVVLLLFPPPPGATDRLSLCVNNSCRVYQDAEVNVTQNFTSQKPISLSPKRNLPDTITGILQLDPESVVFYVGGYPEDFTVTSHCCYFIICYMYLIFTLVETQKDFYQTRLLLISIGTHWELQSLRYNTTSKSPSPNPDWVSYIYRSTFPPRKEKCMVSQAWRRITNTH